MPALDTTLDPKHLLLIDVPYAYDEDAYDEDDY